MKKSLEKAVASLETMEETRAGLQAARKAVKEAAKAEKAEKAERISAAPKKTSFIKRLDENKERVEREKLTLPTPERAKAQEVAV